MLALAASVFVASLLGSPHCAGMCGPFVPLAIPRRGASKPWRPLLAYHLGRLGAYLLVGAIAGTVGYMLERGGSLLGMQRASTMLAGAIMIAFGVVGLLRRLGLRLPLPDPSSKMAQILHAATAAAGRLGPVRRATTIGLLTAFMPCGWLYVFAVAAAGTGSPAWGPALMVAFWLGTLPALTAVGVVIHRLSPRVRAHLPWVVSVLLVAMGIYAIAFRADVVPTAPTQSETVPTEAPCH